MRERRWAEKENSVKNSMMTFRLPLWAKWEWQKKNSTNMSENFSFFYVTSHGPVLRVIWMKIVCVQVHDLRPFSLSHPLWLSPDDRHQWFLAESCGILETCQSFLFLSFLSFFFKMSLVKTFVVSRMTETNSLWRPHSNILTIFESTNHLSPIHWLLPASRCCFFFAADVYLLLVFLFFSLPLIGNEWINFTQD